MHRLRRTVSILTLLLLLAGCTASVGPAAAEGDATVSHSRVLGHNGDEIAITVFRPGGASVDAPVPVILHSHGWSGSRAKSAGGLIGDLLEAGYGVVSVDARGHGESGGEANVHNRHVEVKDFQAVLDWIHDHVDWAAKEDSGIPRDLVLGAIGGSYGGGYQLMTASFDPRLDALVPQMTWNDLTYSLAPHGVVKSVWVDALYGAAKASGTRIMPEIDDWYREAMATNAFPQAAYDHFKASSPEPANIRADVLLVQGIPDLLFNLNEAVANYRALEDGNAGDVRLVTYLGGHVLPGVQPTGLGPKRGGEPCGAYGDLALAWFNEKLLGHEGAADAIPEVALATETGECLVFDGVPEASYPHAFPAPVAVPQGVGSLLLPIDLPAQVAAAEADGQWPVLAVAGVPHLRADLVGAGLTDVILQAGLVKIGPDGEAHVVDDQSTGIRVSPGEPLDVDLAGVATLVEPDDQLFLRIDTANEWYAHNGNRAPGAVVLENARIDLPVQFCWGPTACFPVE